ncbi:MAG: DUF3563 family protein [Betaproteobacteria bacterium]|nr:DUF3563 family protein [Betaproteobacteria bacterium]
MRNIVLAQDGGAIAGPTVQAKASTVRPAEPKSQLEAAGKPALAAPYADLPGAVAAAHRARGEGIARLLRAFVAWLTQGLKRAMRSDVERYLARSTDLADLERRLQALARGEHPRFY